MAAGSWFDWTTGDLVTEAKFQDIQDSIVFIYASDAAANSALTNKVEGTVYFNTTDDILKVWDGSAWIDIAGGLESFTADFLLIAGGASCGNGTGAGGGGAGGYRNSYSTESSGGGASSETSLTLVKSLNYVVTVGAGASAGGIANFLNGFDSQFGQIVSIGGGEGGAFGNGPIAYGRNGGSGGGAGALGGNNTRLGGSGTTNQGFAGGAIFVDPAGGGSGGGGGASAVGQDGQSTTLSGNGGAGLSSSITGSSVNRAGGGGGGCWTSGMTAGTASDGGGAGSNANNGTGTSGTANTGGGGGGGGYNSGTAGSGGSGVVIIRYPTADATISVGAGLTSSSTTDGSDTVVTFTAGTDTVSFS